MKIADLFGSNKNVAVINLYCQKHGITMPDCESERVVELVSNRTKFFVFIDGKGVETLVMSERSTLVGKIVGYRVKRGTVIYFHDGAYRVVTPENWNETWKMITPKAPQVQDDRIIVPIRKRTMFDDALPDRPQKKFSKRGFSRTHTANEAMMRLQSIHVKIIG